MCLCKIGIRGQVTHALSGYRRTIGVEYFWTGSAVF